MTLRIENLETSQELDGQDGQVVRGGVGLDLSGLIGSANDQFAAAEAAAFGTAVVTQLGLNVGTIVQIPVDVDVDLGNFA